MSLPWKCADCGAINESYGHCCSEGCMGAFSQFKHDPTAHQQDAAHKENGIFVSALDRFEKEHNMQNMYDVIFELVKNGAVLTGSRAFGTEVETSDWDFFVDDSFILPPGFKLDGESWYEDKNTAKVYRHECFRIHIQVSKDIIAKKKAQALLLTMPRFIFRNLEKPDARRLWDWAFIKVI